MAEAFSEGLGLVKQEGDSGRLSGYVDKAGTVVIQPQFATAGAFDGGLARVTGPADAAFLIGYIDTAGVMVWQIPRD